MQNTKVVLLGLYGLALTINSETNQAVSIASELRCNDGSDHPFASAAFDAIESMIMAQHNAGIDVTTQAFKDALQVVIDAIGNNLQDDLTLREALELADALTIEDDSIRHFNINKDFADIDDEYLDAGDWSFTVQQIDNARREGKTWFIPGNLDDDEEYMLTLERVTPF